MPSKWMPFKDFLILSVKIFLKPDAPKTNAFHVKDVVNIVAFQCETSAKTF